VGPCDVIDGIGDDEILGVEAPLWSETARTLSDIDALAFPASPPPPKPPGLPRGHEPAAHMGLVRRASGAIGPLWTASASRSRRSPRSLVGIVRDARDRKARA
jgi:hexosaminidase